ncbi:phosphatidylinositol 345-trisphosphate 3-phosphatase and dual-specificity protein phosphatase PTEN-like, partial [Trifolium medium]|nr:phosphatidylinositol 345-trisphosphate 3-phosphatase and dual-specificity protein phosphatase PTEN-like [Trifolium medium]
VLFSTKKHPRTKDLLPEDFWFTAPKKGVMVFALPGEPGLTELAGDFKIHFHDRQGDFYCWLNTTMTENRKVLNTSDLDGFDK